MHLHRRVLPILAVLSAMGCATARVQRNPSETARIFEEICAPAKDFREVKGTLWMKLETAEESGQFPAQFRVVAPSQLDMEITNLVGSVEALVRVRPDHYSVKWTGKESVEEEGVQNWRGIPLQWAIELFLGKIPCPPTPGAGGVPETRYFSQENGDVAADVRIGGNQPATERFVYSIKDWGGKKVATHLKWVRTASENQEVEFFFDQPDDVTSSPSRVTAKSPVGEVKIRFKDRKRVR